MHLALYRQRMLRAKKSLIFSHNRRLSRYVSPNYHAVAKVNRSIEIGGTINQ